MTRFHHGGASALCIAAALISLPLSASAAEAGAAEADQPANGGVPDIVVTAQRRSESVQRSSVAIQVFSGEALRSAGVNQARDISKLTPGVVIGQGGAATQIYIRGVGDFTSTPITNPAVATNVDGVYVARSQAIEGNFFDLERIEVLKGPQGTLYGRNASGGAVNLITTKPKLGETSGNVAFEGGNYDLVKAEGAVNLPLGSTVAARGAFQIVHRNGYSYGGTDDDKHESVRLQLYWEPSANFNLRLSGDYSHIGGMGSAAVFKGVAPSIAATLAKLGVALPSDPRANGTDPSLSAIYYGMAAALNRCASNANLALAATSAGVAPIVGQQGFCPAGTSSLYSPPSGSYFGTNLHVNNRFLNFSGEANWKTGNITVTVLPAYRRTRNDYRNNIIFTFDSAPFGKPEASDAASLEARVAYDDSRLKAVAGFYLFDERQTIATRADAGLVAGGNVTFYHLGTTAYAGFGQATFSVTPELRLIAGLRYSVDHKTIEGQGLVQYPATVFFPGGPCFGAAAICPRDSFSNVRNFRRASYKVGVEYDLGPQNMVYVTYATGHKSGGFNPFSLPGTVNTASFYNPEQVGALEVGSRNRFAGGRIQLNLEGFYWKYKDAQEFITTLNRVGGAANALTNAGRATVYGLDAQLALRPTNNDSLQIGGEYLHTKFDSFVYPAGGAVAGLTTACGVTPATPFPIIDCSGRPLPRAPKFSGTASYTHTFQLAGAGRIDATVATQFSSSRYLTIDFTDASRARGFATLDANLTWAPNDTFKVYAFGRNITNRLVYTGAFTQPLLPSLTLATLGAPRTYGLGLSAKF